MTTLGSQNLSSDLLASIGDVVFEDLNGNGLQDPGEPGIAGVTVSLDTNADGTIDATTVTDADGRYEFDGLTPGLQYQVTFERPSGFQFTEPQDPAYGPNSQVLVAFGRVPTGFVTGDFNDDGIPDVITQDQYLPVLDDPLPTASGSLFLGDGTGDFELPFQIDLGSALGDGSAFVSSLAGDFNNDGIDDLAAGIVKVNDGTTVVSLFLSNGDGAFTAATTTQPLSGVPTDWVAGDIDGDGNLDLAIANSTSNDISVLFGDGNGGLSAPTTIANYAEVDPDPNFLDQALKSIALGDLNQDGIQDLVVGVDFIYANPAFDERVATFSVLLGDGSGGFGLPSTTTVADPGESNDESVGGYVVRTVDVADFNNDGNADVITSVVGLPSDTAQDDPLNLITVALGDGTGGFGDPIVTDTGLAVGTVDDTYITVAELNNDGYLDVVSGTGRVYLGDGTGAFTYSENLPGSEKLFTFDQGPLAVTDFNGDNSVDFFGLNQDPFIRNTSPAVALGTGAIDSSGSQSTIITLAPGEVNNTIDSGLIRVMNFEKYVNGEEADDPTQPVSLTLGDAVIYTYSIENTSDFDLGTAENPFSLVDDNGTPENPGDDLIFSVDGGVATHTAISLTDGDINLDGLLNFGETWTLTAETQTAVNGLVTNTAQVSIGDTEIATDTASYEVAPIAVGIDWKPGSNPSAMKLNRGTVPVAILGSDSFDVTAIDIDTLRADDELTGGGVGINVKKNGQLQYSIEDTNADGFADLVAHFDAVSLGSVVNPTADPFLTDNQIYLFGSTTDGQAFVGMQSADDPIKLLA